MATKRQTRLQFCRQAKKVAKNAAAPPITTLLSQYELLISLCAHLSSADIIHLGATSTEHWQYVTSSPKLLKALMENSSCDGTGIIAQARVFGYWDAKPEQATRKCRGKDAQTCYDCGAMVCNMCRFHTRYPIWGPYSTETTLWVEGLSDDEQDQFDSVWDADEQHLSEWIESGEETPATFPCYVETVKAFNMLYSMMGRAHCEDCKPLPSQLEEDLEENYYSPEVCHCDTFEHFSYHWRCIQCVLAEEAKLVTMQQKVKFTLERESMGGHRFSRTKLCACGKSVAELSLETCGLCGKVTGWYEGHKANTMGRIHAQLGTTLDGRGDDPILSQLG